MTDYYKLDGHKVVPADDLMDWAQFFEKRDRHVDTTMIGDVRVSTVFLGINHALFGGPPLLFKTMIFGGEDDGYQTQCSTWEQAEDQHRDACAIVRQRMQ